MLFDAEQRTKVPLTLCAREYITLWNMRGRAALGFFGTSNNVKRRGFYVPYFYVQYGCVCILPHV